ncbi:MAG: hydrogenase maturation protein HypF [Rhodospirillaceae bacterium]|nr:MAG: hydrogenase maturation protein HypF [Rhodospirillaceae bacterium]
MNGVAEPWFRWEMDLEGTIQGVGFRPAVHRLAHGAGLHGSVENRSGGVHLVLIGPEHALHRFLEILPDRLPVHARLERVTVTSRTPVAASAGSGFQIRPGTSESVGRISIPPDLVVCAACLAEIMDPGNRRYGYPFTSCTQCGPRCTVLERLPYDRANTSLHRFPLCRECLAEYENPQDRRFHAESTACPVCGPKTVLLNSDGTPRDDQGMGAARRALGAEKILAVRGLGGFQLVVDPLRGDAVQALRRRKGRPHKPLAVIARSLAVVRSLCPLTRPQEDILQHPSGPILVLDLPCLNESGGWGEGVMPTGGPARTAAPRFCWDLLTPDSHTLGIMLPTTPLHHLLFHPLAGDDVPPFDLLVVTSGNRSGEPLCMETQRLKRPWHDWALSLICSCVTTGTSCAAPTTPFVSSRTMGLRSGAVPGAWCLKPCA